MREGRWETKRLPPLGTLLCPVLDRGLVAAEGMPIHIYADFSVQESAANAAASTVLTGAKGLKRRRLASHPHPRSGSRPKHQGVDSAIFLCEDL